MSNLEIPILISGVGGGSLGRELIKAFKMANHEYKIVATDINQNSIGFFETNYRYIVPKASSPNYIEIMLKICQKEKIKVLVAGSEPEIEIIAENQKVFSEIGIEVLSNPWNVIKKCVDKFGIMNFLNTKGIRCPMTKLFENETDLNQFTSYPIIIKPRFGSGSRNVFIAYDKEDALQFIKYLKKYGHEVILQEHIGNYEEEFTIGVIFADNGKLCTSIAMKRILEGGISTREISINPTNRKKYVISSGISQGYFEDFKEIRKVGEKIAEILGANGPINIQCRNTQSGIVPFEINPRFSGTVALRSLVGHNEPDMMLRYRLFNEIPKKSFPKFGLVLKDFTERLITEQDMQNFQKI